MIVTSQEEGGNKKKFGISDVIAEESGDEGLARALDLMQPSTMSVHADVMTVEGQRQDLPELTQQSPPRDTKPNYDQLSIDEQFATLEKESQSTVFLGKREVY